MNGRLVAAVITLGAVWGARAGAECSSVKACATECRDGKAASCDTAGRMFFNGRGVDADRDVARKLFAIGCNAGSGNACVNLGMMTREGYGIAPDENRAAELFEMGCFAGSARGCVLVGEFCDKRGGDGDAHRAQLAFERACKAGDRDGCLRLAKAVGDAGDSVRAAAMFLAGCEKRVAEACAGAADLYSAGNGVEVDEVRAKALRTKACDLGDESACLALAGGLEESEHAASAVAIYKRLCDRGSGAGCYRLALLYSEGDGVPADEKRAGRLFKRACDLGDSEACDASSDE